MIRKLGAAFTAAATLITAGCESEIPPLSVREPLTPAESTLLTSIFGPAFDTAAIVKNHHNRDPHAKRRLRHKETTPAALVYGGDTQDMHFILSSVQLRDYARSEDPYAIHLFVHEATHLWQNRGGSSPKSCRTYTYDLTAVTQFEDLCSEQQAEAVADYADTFLSPHAIHRAPTFNFDDPWDVRKFTLMQMIEKKFPHTRPARLLMEARSAAFHACMATSPEVAYATPAQEAQCTATHRRSLRNQPLLDTSAQQISFAGLSSKR